MDSILLQPLIYLCAAGVMVPIAERLGLGSVLGYLLAGVAIGPVFGFVGSETHALQSFAEIGVVFLLFLVGLELQPRMLWDLRARLLGLGGLQVLLSAVALGALALILGNDLRVALAAGLILALSSTAIVLQTLAERGLLKTEGGRASVAILLFQDVFVIVILAILPLLSDPTLSAQAHGAEGEGAHGAAHFMTVMPGWAQALITVAAVAGFVIAGRLGARPVLRLIAAASPRETFTVIALLLVVGIAFLTSMLGLSPALGGFLAGVVLADSEFRHELESDVEPFKGVLLGLFFITVGAGMQFSVLVEAPGQIAAWVAGIILLKIAVLYPIVRAFGLPPSERWLAALGLAQAGEFGFILLAAGVSGAVLPQQTADVLSMAVALSMFATPALFLIFVRLVLPYYLRGRAEPEPDTIEDRGVAIIVGIGRFGQIVHRMLWASGFDTVVLDHSMSQVELLRTFGVNAYYGDASRHEVLHAAGIDDARVIVIGLGNRDKAVGLVEYVKATYPNVKIVARAYDRLHYYRLRQAGADLVVREMFGSSLDAACATLEALGVPRERASRMRDSFRAHDEEMIEGFYADFQEDPDVLKNQRYIERARSAAQTFGAVLERDGLLGGDGAAHTDRTPPGEGPDSEDADSGETDSGAPKPAG